MAQDDVGRSGSTSVIDRSLGLLDRAWDAHWALRLACVVLFLDMAMMLRVGHGLWQWSASDKALLSDVGWIAILIITFSFAVAILIPIFLVILRPLIGLLLNALPAFLKTQDDIPYQRQLGYVPARMIRDLALSEKSDFLFRLYEAHEQKKKITRESRERAGMLTATALLATLADWLIAQSIPGSVGLIGAIVKALADWAYVLVTVTVLGAGVIVKWAWFSDERPNTIYYPPLDQELREKERKDKGLC